MEVSYFLLLWSWITSHIRESRAYLTWLGPSTLYPSYLEDLIICYECVHTTSELICFKQIQGWRPQTGGVLPGVENGLKDMVGEMAMNSECSGGGFVVVTQRSAGEMMNTFC